MEPTPLDIVVGKRNACPVNSMEIEGFIYRHLPPVLLMNLVEFIGTMLERMVQYDR